MTGSILNPLYPKPAVQNGTAVAHQSTSVSTVAVAPTGFNAERIYLVVFQVQGADVRVRWDGTDPDTNTGFILAQNTPYTWSTAQYNSAKFIRDASTDATIFAAAFNA